MSKNTHFPSGAQDNSPNVYQRDKIKTELIIKEKYKLLDIQQQILDCGLDKNTKCLILDGVAGTGRTYIATLIALKLLNKKRVSEVNYIRSLIQSQDGETGFLTGDLSEKTYYFNVPFFDKINELLTKPDIDKLMKDKRLNTLPTSMLRGITQYNSVTILDEAQNCLLSTAETVMTRMGEYSLLIICGDSSGSQNDLGQRSGFKKLCEIFNDEESKQNGIYYFRFTSEHVVRSKLVRYVVEKFEKIRTLIGNGNGNGNRH